MARRYGEKPAAQVAYRVAKTMGLNQPGGGPSPVGSTPLGPTFGNAPGAFAGQGGLTTPAGGPINPGDTQESFQNLAAWIKVRARAQERQKAQGVTPPAAGGAAAAPGAGAAPGEVDPLAAVKADPGYVNQLAQNTAQQTFGLEGLATSDRSIAQGRDTSLSRLTQQYAQQRDNISTGANKQGLLYSGVLGKRLGDAEQGFQQTTGDIRHNAENALAQNAHQRDYLKTQYGDPTSGDYGLAGNSALTQYTEKYAQEHPVPATVTGQPGENGLPAFAAGGFTKLNKGYAIQYDTTTGKAKLVKTA
jgi:hypothetical protein